MCRDPLSFDKVFLLRRHEARFLRREHGKHRTDIHRKPPLYRLIFSPVPRMSPYLSLEKVSTSTPQTSGTPSCDAGESTLSLFETGARGDAPEDKETSSACFACATHHKKTRSLLYRVQIFVNFSRRNIYIRTSPITTILLWIVCNRSW